MSINRPRGSEGIASPLPPAENQSPAQHAPSSFDAELPLNESESKYQRLVEGISGDYVIYTHDPSGLITYVSPSIETVLGYPVESVIGLNWRDLIGEHFLGRELADQVAEDVAAGKNFYGFTVEISHANGSTRLIEIQQRPLLDATGQYISMEGIAKDITEATRNAEELQRLKQNLEALVAERTTELIRANEKLRGSEARYRSVVECQTEFVVRWMPGAIFTFVNDAFCRYVERTNEELIGWCFLPIIHPEDTAAFQAAIEQLNPLNAIATLESRIILPDGSLRWTRWTNQKLFDAGGQFLEFQSVGHDITELKNAADTIREKKAHLAYVSRLAVMGELVAGMAHEVHQPLHAAKTFAEAARRNLEIALSSEQKRSSRIDTAIDCTHEISEAITRTAKIIRGLRDFTRSQSTKFEQLDLNSIVRDACDLIVFETRKAHVKLDFSLAEELPAIQGDRIQLEQICVNLLINAYEAMAETLTGQRKILIRTQCSADYVQLAFCDSGCGVAEQDMEKLYDAFYTTKPGGLGMGLSLCKSIAETHGGRVRSEQNQEVGMTFVLELPLQRRFLS